MLEACDEKTVCSSVVSDAVFHAFLAASTAPVSRGLRGSAVRSPRSGGRAASRVGGEKGVAMASAVAVFARGTATVAARDSMRCRASAWIQFAWLPLA